MNICVMLHTAIKYTFVYVMIQAAFLCGMRVRHVDVDENNRINLRLLKKAIDSDVCMVSRILWQLTPEMWFVRRSSDMTSSRRPGINSLLGKLLDGL